MRVFVPPIEVARTEPSQQAQPGEKYIAPFMGGGGNAPAPPEGQIIEGGQAPRIDGEGGMAPGDYVAPREPGIQTSGEPSGTPDISSSEPAAPSGDGGGSDNSGSGGGEGVISGDSGDSGDSSSSDGGESAPTGSVILTGNAFFDYYYN